MSTRVYHLTQRHVAWPLDYCIQVPSVVPGVGTEGITCNLGFEEPRDLRCVILGPEMAYTAGLGSAEPSLMKTCKLEPPFYPTQNTTHHPFFR